MSIKILQQNCDPELAEDKSLPYTAYIVKYQPNEDEYSYDIVICNRKQIFLIIIGIDIEKVLLDLNKPRAGLILNSGDINLKRVRRNNGRSLSS